MIITIIIMLENQLGKKKSAAKKLNRDEYQQTLLLALYTAREAIQSRFRKMLADYDLTIQQWRILMMLDTVKEMEVIKLARVCFVLQPSIARALKKLEQRDLIRRNPDKNDKRRYNISLSKNGQKLCNIVSPFSQEIVTKITASYGQKKIDDMINMLFTFSDTINNIPE